MGWLKWPSFPRFPSCWVGRATLLGVFYSSKDVVFPTLAKPLRWKLNPGLVE